MTVAAALPAAVAPAETLRATRADVALLVATRAGGALRSVRFAELADLLHAGDVLVVNTSGTRPAALPVALDDGDANVHLSTPLAADRWVVELRTADRQPVRSPPLGVTLALPGRGSLTLLAPYRGSDRLTESEVQMPGGATAYLARHGAPIRYEHDGTRWPLDAYQTVFALQAGSAEMPSAGRPFTTGLVTDLVSRGVVVAPVMLHAGVSSLERGEAPFPERFCVPAATAGLINAARGWGGRVVAVGTTVVRALETAADPDGTVRAAAGWTELVVTPERGLHAVDGLLTGWHEPESSHLLMLEAAAGPELLRRSYAAAAELGFTGHEFGDAHLILP